MSSREDSSLEVTVVANDVGPVGGMERQLTELISGLLEGGHRVTVISWTCDLPPHQRLREIRVPGPSRPFVIAYPWFIAVASLLTSLRGRGLIHSTGAIILNRVDLSTAHFCHQAVARLPAFSRASRATLPYRLNAWFAGWMARLAERWCYRPSRARRLVGVSKGVVGELQREFPEMCDRTLVIPNGVDTVGFEPAEEAGDPVPRRLRALFVGGEWERKGLRLALEALDGAPDVELIVVGPGDAAGFRKFAESLGIDDRVTFVGPSTDVASWYRRADVFVLPTAYETFSLVAYEAAASGLPLLITRVNGVEDILRDGVNGWFIQRDATDIRRRLNALASDARMRHEMGSHAREDSLSFSWSRMVEGYRDLYARLRT